MEIIEKKINSNHIESSIISSYFNDFNYCFIDIETTGLSSERNKVILVGILTKDNFYQFFAENREEEKRIRPAAQQSGEATFELERSCFGRKGRGTSRARERYQT